MDADSVKTIFGEHVSKILENEKIDFEEKEVEISFEEYESIFLSSCRGSVIMIEHLQSDEIGCNVDYNEKAIVSYKTLLTEFLTYNVQYGVVSAAEFQTLFYPPEITKNVLEKCEKSKSIEKVSRKYSEDIEDYFSKICHIFDSKVDSEYDFSWKDKFQEKFKTSEFSARFLFRLVSDSGQKFHEIKESSKFYYITQMLSDRFTEMVEECATKLITKELQFSEIVSNEKHPEYFIREIRKHYLETLREKYVGTKSDFMELFISKRSLKKLKKDITKKLKREKDLVLFSYFAQEFFLALMQNECVSLLEMQGSTAVPYHFKDFTVQRFYGAMYYKKLKNQSLTDKQLLAKVNDSVHITEDFVERIQKRVQDEFMSKFEEWYQKLVENGIDKTYEEIQTQSPAFYERLYQGYFKHTDVSVCFLQENEEHEEGANLRIEKAIKLMEVFLSDAGTSISEGVPRIVSYDLLYYLLLKGTKILKKEDNIIELQNVAKITVVGDLHSQLHSLNHIFRENGWPNEKNAYVFNGDYIDKGGFPIEVLLVLLYLKLLYPRHVFLTRGNHENEMDDSFGFQEVVETVYDKRIYQLFLNVFRALPVAVLYNSKTFIVHAGIGSTHNFDIDYLQNIDRCSPDKLNVKDYEILNDLLWSDPWDKKGVSDNKGRGISQMFGPDVTEKFFKENSVKLLVRSHEMVRSGFEEKHKKKVLTVHSSPGLKGYKGAYLTIDNRLNYQVYYYPYMPENFKQGKKKSGKKDCCVIS